MSRRVATYERVSSDDQRERATILTQYDELQRRLTDEPDIEVAGRYVDDGVSGTTELKDRPDGRRLLADARDGNFDEVWVYRLDRLGRDEIDPLVVKRDLANWGVKLFSLRENIDSPLAYGLQVLLAAEERRTFLERSADGMARAAREGRYCGGIVPYGYRVDGVKAKARLVPDATLIWGEWSAADVVRQIFEKVGAAGQSCYTVADWLNALAIPTHYLKDGREVAKQKGKRAERTSGDWRPGRVRAILTNSTYRGEYAYGKKPGKDRFGNTRKRELIVAPCEALVPVDLWDAAQRTLHDKRLWDPNGVVAVHLLRSRVKCGICGLSYSGAVGTDKSWYRCNGRIAYRRRGHDKCTGRPLDGNAIEPQILDDIRRWLRNPDEDLLDELRTEMRPEAQEAVGEAERVAVEAQLGRLAEERSRLVQSVRKGTFTDDDVASDMARIRAEKVVLEQRLSELQSTGTPESEAPVVDEDLRERLRIALDAGLTRSQLQELVGLLVKQIVVYTEPQDGAKASLRVVVEYNFPLPPLNGAQNVAQTATGRDSTRSPAQNSPGTCTTSSPGLR